MRIRPAAPITSVSEIHSGRNQEGSTMKARRVFSLLIMVATMIVPAAGQTPYKLPPKDVVAILHAPLPPLSIVSPTRDTLLLIEIRPYTTIEALAEPLLRLASVRINPRIGCTQRTLAYSGLTIRPLDNAPARRVELPPAASITRPSWSRDGKKIAFARDSDDKVELWTADIATGAAKSIPGVQLNDVVVSQITWLSDNRYVLAVLVPEGRGPAPARPKAPVGPNIQESSGRLSQMATFQDMLASPYDEDLFQHFATSELARIDTQTGQVERIGPAALISGFEPSPDENYLLVSTVRRPFSYRVPYQYFARKTEVWNAEGKAVATIANLPISDDIPRQGVRIGPRDQQWQPLHDARVVWTDALDGGDPKTKVPHRDKIMALDGPFTGKPSEVIKVQHRFTSLAWLPDKDRALVSEFDRDRRWRTTAVVDLTEPEGSRKVLFDLSINDAYKDPGVPVTIARPDGTRTILKDGNSIYLTGQGAAPDGARPFLDKLDLVTGDKARLFHCGERTFERPLGFVGDSRSTIVISHESKTEPTKRRESSTRNASAWVATAMVRS